MFKTVIWCSLGLIYYRWFTESHPNTKGIEMNLSGNTGLDVTAILAILVGYLIFWPVCFIINIFDKGDDQYETDSRRDPQDR